MAADHGHPRGGAGLAADPNWNPLTPTAADPSYPGAHSALSAAAATALGAVWGDQQTVAVTSAADPGCDAQLHQPAAVADEAGLSRIWAGQHTRIDHEAGQQLGRQVAGAVLAPCRWPAPREQTFARPRRRPGGRRRGRVVTRSPMKG